MNRLQRVALGEAPADLVVRGGRVLRPGSRSLDAGAVAVVGGRIAAITDDAASITGEDTTVLDADGKAVIPGLIDAHAHVDSMQAFERSYHRVLEGGTTAVVSEVAGLGTAFGAEGVHEFLVATRDLPVAVYAVVPPHPLVDTFDPSHASETEAYLLSALLERDRVVGVGEIDWIHVIGRDTPAAALFQRAALLGLPVSGHGAGLAGEELAAFASVIDNDHEAISADDHVVRAVNGIHSIGRYGSIRDDTAAAAGAAERLDAGTVSLATDGMWPRDLLREGYMDAVVRRTIEAGADPIDAVRMASEHPARHFGLASRGRIAPGAVADLVLLDDLEAVAVDTVLAGGDVVVQDGSAVVGPRTHHYPDRFYRSVAVDLNDPFRVPAEAGRDGAVRAIEYAGGLVSEETTVEPPVDDGALGADPDADLCLVSALDRHPAGDGGGFTGFLTGYGLSAGAAATTLGWEVPALVCVGTTRGDMRAAAERVASMGGGWAVVQDGEVLADLPTRVGAVASDLPVEETAERWGEVADALRDLGAAERPLLGLQTLTFAGLPSLKLCLSGYADIRGRTVLGLDPGDAG